MLRGVSERQRHFAPHQRLLYLVVKRGKVKCEKNSRADDPQRQPGLSDLRGGSSSPGAGSTERMPLHSGCEPRSHSCDAGNLAGRQTDFRTDNRHYRQIPRDRETPGEPRDSGRDNRIKFRLFNSRIGPIWALAPGFPLSARGHPASADRNSDLARKLHRSFRYSGRLQADWRRAVTGRRVSDPRLATSRQQSARR